MTTVKDAAPGDVIETPNGNRYTVLPNGKLAYLGNRVLERSQGLLEPDASPCKVIGKARIPAYLTEGDEIGEDWDTLKGVERIPVPLPRGCTCGYEAVLAVLGCPVHEIKFRPDTPPKEMSDAELQTYLDGIFT